MARHFGVLGFCLLLCSGQALAAGRLLEAQEAGKVRIDGQLSDWPGKMTSLGENVQGGIGSDRAAAQIAYDDKFVYVAFKVTDAKLVRTQSAGNGEDHGTLLVAVPSTGGKGFTTYTIELYPGDPGKLPGAVKIKGSSVAGAELVEAPAKGGYSFEARIPWSALPETARVRVGMRGAFRFTDADSPGSVNGVVGTSTGGAGSQLPPLQLEAEMGLDASLVRQKGLSRNPSREAYGDVAGDKMVERVAVYGEHLTIVGPKYRGGKQFYFGELGVTDASMVTRLALRDFDGDGKDDIFIQKKIGQSDKYREIVQVLKVGSDDTPWAAFSHEVSIVTEKGRIENEVKIVKKGKLFAVEISQGKADGFEPDTYAEPTSDDMGSAFLPWQTIKSRVFQWDGKTFKQAEETTQAGKKASSGKSASGKKPKKAGPPAPPKPRPPSADEMLDRLYALYKKERKLGGKAPRFDFVTDVAGNTDTERVLVHDKDIVVFGKGYRGGMTYSFITIGVADSKDIVDVTARDLTGDGKAEVIVRGVLHAKASKELGGDVVDRYALFIYQVGEGAIKRVFAAETGRQLKSDRILGTVAFVPGDKGVRIELRPGHAVGWTEKSYPFPPDSTTAGGLEPLLLPWSGSSPKKYGFDGSAFAAK
jgi:hypothetical protein